LQRGATLGGAISALRRDFTVRRGSKASDHPASVHLCARNGLAT